MLIRDATEADWPQIWPFFQQIVLAGETYAYDPNMTSDDSRNVWMMRPPARTVVAVDGPDVLGSATTGPNRPGRGSHVATGSFMVSDRARGRGVGRALGEDGIAWARRQGFRSMQFNAVVESNRAAITLWKALGFEVIGTVPEAFEHPTLGYVGLHVMYRRL
jgi:L-amino acid N-acyltransferase YncA